MKLIIPILSFVLFQVSSTYFNQTPPGNESKVFAPGIISIDSISEFGSTYSKDGQEFFYAVERKGGRAETYSMKLVNNKWTAPKKILTHKEYSYNDPMLSPDQQRLFFISDQPMNGSGPKKDFDIWYVERKGDGWSQPMNAGPEINSDKNEYYMSFSSSGTMYYSSGRHASHDIFMARRNGTSFRQAEKLGSAINTEHYEGDVFVAPDESYLIVASEREGKGSGDLYISFKNNNDWTPLKNMGPKVNGPRFDYCPFVTGDGKFLLYTRADDIRWIDAKIIDTLK